LLTVAEIVTQLGIEPVGLPVAKARSGWVTLAQIEQVAKTMDKVLLVQDAAVSLAEGKVTTLRLNKGVFAVGMGAMAIIQSSDWVIWPPRKGKGKLRDDFDLRTLAMAAVKAIARAWNCSFEEARKNSSFGTDDKSFREEIGVLSRKPFVERVYIVRRPTKGARENIRRRGSVVAPHS
jgi:hypothetical protein